MTSLRITVAQLNPTIGDISGNIRLMCRAAEHAQADLAQLVVFPELSLTGYYPGDMLDEPEFAVAVARGLANLLEATRRVPGLHWVIGAPTRREQPGKPWHNTLLVLADGKIVLEYAKQLLPTYNVFNELRHFEPGPDVAKVLRIGDCRVGFLVCEDCWNDADGCYAINPFERLADAAPDLVVSINASPSNVGKRELRHAMLTASSRRHNLPLLYVNQVGGQDQLVFDGGSFAVTPEGGVEFEATQFAEEVTSVDFLSGTFRAIEKPDTAQGLATELRQQPVATLALQGQICFEDRSERTSQRENALQKPTKPTQVRSAQGGIAVNAMEFYRRQIVLGLADYARRCGFQRAVVGCSGGIDSALTIALAAEALGPQNVTAVTMPSRFSSAGSVTDSEKLCANLNVRLFNHPIAELVTDYTKSFSETFSSPLQGVALENVQARIRGTILMEYSNAFGHLLLTTGNKSEISVGYCTLYGDTNGGLGLIGDLYKTEVFELCRHLNRDSGREIIPVSIIEKEPSAELAPGQRDADTLPSYPVLDNILKYLIEGRRLSASEFAFVHGAYVKLEATTEGQDVLRRVKRLIAINEYKRRQAPPVLRLRERAFGSGRQMPIAAKYEY